MIYLILIAVILIQFVILFFGYKHYNDKQTSFDNDCLKNKIEIVKLNKQISDSIKVADKIKDEIEKVKKNDKKITNIELTNIIDTLDFR